MPEIKNNFLKGRMNQDLDSRILPPGEYREAINLLISRSESNTVGEFENVLGNTGYQLPGLSCHVIGHFVDETNNIVYLFTTNYDGAARATSSNTCNILQVNLDALSITTLVNGYWLNFSTAYPIYGVNLIDDLLFWTDNFNQPRRINITTAQQPDAYTTESQISVAQYYPYEPIVPLERTTATVKLDNTNNTSTQIVLTTSCPNIKVGDIVTVNNKTQAPGDLEINNQTPPVRVTEVVSTTGDIDTFKVFPAMTSGTPPQAITRLDAGTIIDFSRTTMENTSEQYLSNFSIQTVDAVNQQGTDIEITDPSFGGLPRVGDIVKLQSTSSGTTLPYYELRVATLTLSNTSFNRWRITFDKSMIGPVSVGGAAATGFQANDVITIGTNPNYNANFKGDSKFLEDKFVRFSYRFRYENNEYSLMAPFTQIMFIPKQFGQFSLGQLTPDTDQDVNYYQDETDAYTSTIIQWFENDIDSIKLKIPVPTTLAELNTLYNIKEIDILYRESDALAVKVLDTIDVSGISTTTTINYDDDIIGLLTKNYIDYDYKSNKPYKTLPEGQTTRVYDKVPVKALAQELISNRIVYGNYTERMTPPATIDYRTSFSPRDARYSDYATEYPYSTVKQNRTYQVGFVLVDYYGRQSDVILSSYDNLNSNEGSSIYVPYRNSGDATDVPVLEWIGQNLTLTIDNAFGKGTGPGEPGIYREEGFVAGITIDDAGSLFEADKTYAADGAGGCTIRVTSVDGSGRITAAAVATGGSGYTNGATLILLSPAGGDDAELEITTGIANPLGWYSYKIVVKQQEQEYYNVYLPGFINGLPIQNKLWDGAPYSTLGGSGNANNSSPGVTDIETERNKIFFSTVLSDNINKIPRNLQEVGPTDEEYNSDELLYIRINNINAKEDTTTGVRNSQYYPNKLVQNVLNLSTVKETELAAVPFVEFKIPMNPSTAGALINSVGNERVYGWNGPGGFQGDYGSTVQVVLKPLLDSSGDYYGAVKHMPTGSLPWGDVADKASFYAADQNPFIMKVGQVSNYNNPIGAIVCGAPFPQIGGSYLQHDTNYPNGVRTMQPILSVAETKPVYSLLDLFWETTLCGKIEQLNCMIETNYNGIVAITDNGGTFAEDIGINGNVGDAFYFINGTGAQINSFTNLTPTISKVVRQSNPSQALTPISDYFAIAQDGSNAGQYHIQAKKKYWYGDTSTSTDVYILDLSTTWAPGSETYTDDLPGAITLSLTNLAPSIYSDSARTATSFTVAMDSTEGPNIIQLFGLNGSSDTTVVDGTQNRYKQLAWSLGNVLYTAGGANTVWSINSSTGQITATNLVDEVTYTVPAILTDASGGTGALTATQNITVNVGVPFAPKAIASGRQGNANLAGEGNAGEWIWADVANTYVPTANVLSASPSLIYNAQKEYQASGGGNTCKAWLWQGTIEIELTMTSVAHSSPGDASSSFLIQRRTFTPPTTRGSWEQIDSVVESNFNTQTATSSPQNIGVAVNSSVNTAVYRYKFDQLGEYRVITSSLTGDRAAYVSIQVQFKDGMCRNNSSAGYCANNGPCTP